MEEEQLNQILGKNVSRETFERLFLYRENLLKWNKSINLISRHSETSAWERHFIDSSQIYNFIDVDKGGVYDLGSGAGFPGMVLAVLLGSAFKVSLIEADERKCLFLKNVSRETNTDVSIYNDRVENCSHYLDPPEFITSRALCSVFKTFDLTYPWILKRPDVVFYLLKGRTVKEEIIEAQRKYHFDFTLHNSVTSEDGFVLKVSSLRLK